MTQAAPPDLSKLRIDRSLAPVVARRRRRWLWWGGILLRRWPRPAAGSRCSRARSTVQTTSVVTTYPSQQFVAAQCDRLRRRAAQGRDLVEGHRPPRVARRGGRLARQGRRRHRAHRRARRRGAGRRARRPTSRAARAALEQALAEERDAVAQLKRNQDLLAKGFVSAAAVDTAKARAEKATAGVANARATIGVGRSHRRATRRSRSTTR